MVQLFSKNQTWPGLSAIVEHGGLPVFHPCHGPIRRFLSSTMCDSASQVIAVGTGDDEPHGAANFLIPSLQAAYSV